MIIIMDVIIMPDRRVKRTKNNIYSALVELMLERDIGNITVKELCEKADINKSTFYLHFMDIYDCKEKWQNEMLNEILSQTDSYSLSDIEKNTRQYISATANYFNEHADFFIRIANSPLAAEFSFNIKSALRARIAESNKHGETLSREEATLVAFIMGGIFDACLININDFDAKQLTETLTSIIKNTIKGIANKNSD